MFLLSPEPPSFPSALSSKPCYLGSKEEGIWLPDEMMELWAGEEDRQALDLGFGGRCSSWCWKRVESTQGS